MRFGDLGPLKGFFCKGVADDAGLFDAGLEGFDEFGVDCVLDEDSGGGGADLAPGIGLVVYDGWWWMRGTG